MPNQLSLFRGESGVERAREIIERMRAHDVPPTPPNYEIWAAYMAGVSADLSREIEARIAQGQSFSDDVNEDLFERFFANTRLSVQILETTKTLAGDLNESVNGLREAGTEAGSYAGMLQTAVGGLDTADAGQARLIVSQVQAATHGMVEHNLKLAEQLEAAARQVAALKFALESIKVEALTDGLTGLANRKMFDETLERRIRDAQAASSDLCVVLIDADNFGKLNENWGQTLGDQVLRYIGAVLAAHAQGDVLAARFGADDFALIAPRTNVNLAEALAARMSRTIKAKQLSLKSTGDKIAEIKVSMGVACFNGTESGEELVSRARACLLAAKAAGRDKIITDLQLRRQSAA